MSPSATHIDTHRRRGQSPPRAARAVLVWSISALALGAGWWSGLLPRGVPEGQGMGSLFAALETWVGAVCALVLGGVGTVCALLMGRRPAVRAVQVTAWALAGASLVLFVDGSLLALLGYTMIMPVVGWLESGPGFGEWARTALGAQSLTLLFFTAGVVLWALAALRYRRGARGGCERCGRTPGWGERCEHEVRVRALRVGRTAVLVACVVALFYPLLRVGWLFGVHVGISEEFFAAIQDDGALVVGVGLGAAGLVGVVLMTGLVRPWGVRLPWWGGPWAGRRVPVSLAVVPASVVAVALVGMGRSTVVQGLSADGSPTDLHVWAFASMGVWGVALAVATVAYVVRRRGRCGACGQGVAEQVDLRVLREALVA